MRTLRFLLPYVRPYRWQYVIGLVFVPLSAYSALAVPRLMGDAIRELQTDASDLAPIVTICQWIAIWTVLRGFGLYVTRHLIIGASRRFEFDLRNDLFEHLQTLDRQFYTSTRTGDIMTRATLDVEAARLIVGPVILFSASCLFMLGMALPLMLSLNPTLTLLVMVPLGFLTIAVRTVGPRVHEASRRAQDALAELSSFAQQNFGGIRVVKAFSMEQREVASFRARCDEQYDRSLAVERLANWMGPIVAAAGELAVVLLLVIGGRLILEGDFSLDRFVTFTGYQALLIWPMISLGWVINQLYRGVASVDRLTQVFAERSRVRDTAPLPAGAPPLPERFRGEIEIRNLRFSYGGDEVLSDISMRIPAGATVALVGRTGAGKSTLTALLSRLLAVPNGTIFLDGIDINRVPIDHLRRSIGVVPQETFLFSRSIAENIAYAIASEGDDEGLGELVQRFGAVSRFDKDLDQFPRGYAEVVGERGVTLSGGQRQRVSISRALLGDPSIVVFDDALSSVDTHTEEEILSNLREATRRLTVLVVSHRISSVRNADRIYVLDEGRIVEEGTHDELVALGGRYAELARQQRLADELEEL